jgi:programmed cell death 6-interacting protein
MEKVSTLRATRDSIETSLKDTTVDISARFLAALDAEGGLAEQSISEAQLTETYGPLQAQVQQNLAEQEQLVKEIQAAHGQFVSVRGGGASARDSVLKDLAAAHDAFMELKSNLGEGTKFYSDLTQLLVKFQTKVGDLVFARNTEKEDMTR